MKKLIIALGAILTLFSFPASASADAGADTDQTLRGAAALDVDNVAMAGEPAECMALCQAEPDPCNHCWLCISPRAATEVGALAVDSLDLATATAMMVYRYADELEPAEPPIGPTVMSEINVCYGIVDGVEPEGVMLFELPGLAGHQSPA